MSASEAAPSTRFLTGLSSTTAFFLTGTSFFFTEASSGIDLISFLRVATRASTSSKEKAIGVALLLAASPSRATDGFLAKGIGLVA